MADALLLLGLFVGFLAVLVLARALQLSAPLRCLLFRHRFEVVRVLKPWLHTGVHPMLGCDLRCARCGRVSLWENAEKLWHADFLKSGETPETLALLPGIDHPNHLCPCQECRNV